MSTESGFMDWKSINIENYQEEKLKKFVKITELLNIKPKININRLVVRVVPVFILPVSGNCDFLSFIVLKLFLEMRSLKYSLVFATTGGRKR